MNRLRLCFVTILESSPSPYYLTKVTTTCGPLQVLDLCTDEELEALHAGGL
jgi:hypothetical protein